jgi:hypothetical protein
MIFNEVTFAFAIGWVILAIIFLWFIIGAKGHWFLKLTLISIATFFCFVMWNSTDKLLGLPTQRELPDKYLIHWIVVKQPTSLEKNPSIYIWAKDLTKKEDKEKEKTESSVSFTNSISLVYDTNDPKTYKLPYSKGAHEQARSILKELKAGQKVIGQKGKKGTPGQCEICKKPLGKGQKLDNGKGEKSENSIEGRGSGQGREGKKSCLCEDCKKNRGLGSGAFGDSKHFQHFEFYKVPPPKPPKKLYK